MISYLLPTRDRSQSLARTLRALGERSAEAHARVGGAEVVVVDDASLIPVNAPTRLANGMAVRVVRRPCPEGAAARNAGARVAAGTWLVMLDDDSYPLDDGVVAAIADAPAGVVAIGGEVRLAGGGRDAGGLPEVFVGCAAAIRRAAFLDVGGYDPSFHYYVEEYDLCGRLIRGGGRITHDWRFVVRHEKTRRGRDMNAILRRLVRNSGWVVERYAPASRRRSAALAVVTRYETIARREGAMKGYRRGLAELRATAAAQPRRPLDAAAWDRFTGFAHARAALLREDSLRGTRVALVDNGKNAAVVRRVLETCLDCTVVDEPDAEHRVIGTLSPGPMMDAWERRAAAGETVVRPWEPAHVGSTRNEQRLRRPLPV